MSEHIQIVVVDDHPLFREGVVNTLQAEPDFEVVGEGASAKEALELAQNLLPDLVLLDIDMPGGGLNALRAVVVSCPVTKVVMLTVSEAEDDVLDALKAGARAYVLKGVSGRELRSILRGVFAGEVYVSPTLAGSVLREMTGSKPSEHNPLEDLTEREHEILEWVAKGLSNKQIGSQLNLTEKTIKHYMSNIMQKLHVRNRVQAAMLAQKVSRPD